MSLKELAVRCDEARTKIRKHETLIALTVQGVDGELSRRELEVLQDLFNTRNELKASLQNVQNRYKEVSDAETKAAVDDACGAPSSITVKCWYGKGHTSRHSWETQG